MKTHLILIALFAYKLIFANEPLLDSANAAYSKNIFNKAITYYETVLGKGYESAELYYNLGNAYYKSNKIGLAIANYERAKKLAPGDEDINFNLKMANQKLVDKVEPAAQFFLKEWFLNFLNMLTEKGWSVLSIFILILSLSSFAIYFLSRQTSLRKLGFWLGSALLLFCVCSFFTAMKSHHVLQQHNEAVVVVQTLNVKGSPTEDGTNLFILHEGTKTYINQINGDWVEVKIPTGTGWAQAKDLIII